MFEVMPFSFEEVNQLYKRNPSWLQSFLDFLSKDPGVNSLMLFQKSGIGTLSRVLSPLFETVKKLEETKEFLLAHPFYLFLLSGKTPQEFENMLLQSNEEKQKEIDEILGTAELFSYLYSIYQDCGKDINKYQKVLKDGIFGKEKSEIQKRLSHSIFAQYEQGKIYEWVTALGYRVYLMMFDQKGHIRKEVFQALDTFINESGEKVLVRMPKVTVQNTLVNEDIYANVFDIVHTPLTGVVATSITEIVTEGLNAAGELDKDKLPKNGHDGLYNRYWYHQIAMEELSKNGQSPSSIDPSKVALAEALIFFHAGDRGTKFYYEVKYQVLLNDIAKRLLKEMRLTPYFDPTSDVKPEDYSDLCRKYIEQSDLLIVMAQLDYIEKKGTYFNSTEEDTLNAFIQENQAMLQEKFIEEVFARVNRLKELRNQELIQLKKGQARDGIQSLLQKYKELQNNDEKIFLGLWLADELRQQKAIHPPETKRARKILKKTIKFFTSDAILPKDLDPRDIYIELIRLGSLEAKWELAQYYLEKYETDKEVEYLEKALLREYEFLMSKAQAPGFSPDVCPPTNHLLIFIELFLDYPEIPDSATRSSWNTLIMHWLNVSESYYRQILAVSHVAKWYLGEILISKVKCSSATEETKKIEWAQEGIHLQTEYMRVFAKDEIDPIKTEKLANNMNQMNRYLINITTSESPSPMPRWHWQT
ncbi:MAG: hypothetical protein JSS53_01390 [Proteobacteria bacterium]|nr:hypothetical protein [Pseudomonadota bacterium]